LEAIVFLVGANLFFSVCVNLSNGKGQLLRDLACGEVFLVQSLQDDIQKLKLTTLDRFTIGQANDASDLKLLTDEAVHLEGHVGEDLVIKGVFDSVLHNDAGFVDVLDDLNRVFS